MTDVNPGRVGKVEQGDAPPGKARQEVDLSSSYLEDNSKPGLHRSLRPLSCKLWNVCPMYLYSYPSNSWYQVPLANTLVKRPAVVLCDCGLYLFLGIFPPSRGTGACPVTADLIMRVNVITIATTSHDTWYCMFEIKHSAAQHSAAPQDKARHRTALLSYSWAELSWECILCGSLY